MTSEALIFQDGPTTFALQLSEIKEIINLRRILSLPFSSPFLLGLANLRGSMVPVLSPYLLHGGRARYVGDVEYASVIESVGMEVAVACQKIIGVKNIDIKKLADDDKVNDLFAQFRMQGKRMKWIRVPGLISHASENIFDERFSEASR